ncbi:DUF1631 domain-containing protein [Thiohalobacter sp. IOR34]|uniref:DUF1631 domain-containing protein n=1 Tax=Thiohalobacter sp. IOR34 TaxID=3057176 RepID=UPI0025B20888|nr:DUF1631 domain-containing protein [Thiohalobacter sp. IOR34]WJW76532.1 DUF1631 domain-containing protein [Thiohalobacter sp. IOR34]
MTPTHLAPLLIQMLEQAEVGLLEAAERAENNEMQNQYFAVMKAIKHNQNRILQTFLQGIDRGFADFLEGRAGARGDETSLDAFEADQLALVDKDEVDWALPVQNLVSRANAEYVQALYALDQRLAVINGGSKLAAEALPGGPQQIAEAFRDALRGLDTVKQIRLMLFASFDRHVMRELGPYFEEYNRRLVNAGVLPNLSYEIRKHQDPRRVARDEHQPPDGSPPEEADEETFRTISRLLAERRAAAGEAGGSATTSAAVPGEAPAGGDSSGAAGGSGGGLGGRVALVGAINQLQEAQSQAQPRGEPDLDSYFEDIRIDKGLLDRLQSILDQERKRLYEYVDRRHLTEEDVDVIDLVGMLFEFMLRDKTLPNVAKALLSRLHTPYLKVAILDKAFFVQKRHPARRLLDAMVEAGSQWIVEDDLQRGIFPCMRHVVEQVLDEFEDDLDLFEELLQAFSVRVREIEHKASLIEKRSVEAADGQARLQDARRRAHAQMARMLAERQLPEEAFEFFSRVWSEKLMFILLREKEGEQSAAWKLAIRVAGDIIDSIEPQMAEVERARIKQSLAALRQAIHMALNDLSPYGPRDNEQMFEQIVAWQDAALLTPQAVAEAARARSERAPEMPAEPVKAPLPPEAEAAARRLESVDFGTWFEFHDTQTELVRRLRLAWFSEISSNYMFVDAIGVKAAEYSRDLLARMMAQGEVSIVETEKRPFIERALAAVLGLLGRRPDSTLTH